MRRAAVLAVSLLTVLVPAGWTVQAAEPPSIVLRTGEHPGYGRMVFDMPPGTTAEPVQDGDHVVVHFSPAVPVDASVRAPRNVLGVSAAPGEAELTLAPGAQLRRMRLGSRLVIDVLDPPKPPGTVAPIPKKSGSTKPLPVKVVPPAALPVTPPAALPVAPVVPAVTTPVLAPAALVPAALPAVAPVGSPGPVSPVAAPVPTIASAAPVQLAAVTVPVPSGMTGHAILLPFDTGVGAAAFRRGDAGFVVFDQRKPIDMASLQGDPVFASATVQLLPAGTLLRLALPTQDALQLTRGAAGWMVTMQPGNPAAGALRPIAPHLVNGAVHLPADAPGQIVSVPDQKTGLMLLVGTQRQPGQGVAVSRRMPAFALLPTWQGVVVEPVSDALLVLATTQDFVIQAGAGRSLNLAAPSPDAMLEADAQHFSRRFDFPAEPIEALRQRLLKAVDAAAATPLQARGAKRMAVAQAMLALGMGVEAQSVLTLAATDDGRLANDPSLIGLSAIAALVAGRPAEAAGLDDSRLTGTDEIALWRAVRAAMAREGAPDAAPVFAANLPLLLSYPAALRGRLLPLAAETMALGGELAAAQRLLDQRPDDHSLDLARGFALQAAGGDPKPVLAIYDRLAQGSDRLVSARAANRAVELRLASGALTPAQGADALDKLMYSWRGDGRELALREREAELRRQAGQWRPALALLRETEQVFPDQRPVLQSMLAKTFADALAQDAKTPLPALDLVSLAEENADLIPDGEAGQALATRLADRLTALDLPAQATPVLEKLVAQAPVGPIRAQFGGRLAALHMDQGDAAGALAALTRSAAPDLPAPLTESRTLTFARAAAAAGDLPSATAALAALGTPAAKGLRADLLEAAKDWPAAEVALRDVVAVSVPDAGMLDEAQGRLMLRLASAAAQAGDEATLADLRDHVTSRLPAGQLADMFRVLTAGPVSGVADLPRAERETKLAGGLSADLKSLTP